MNPHYIDYLIKKAWGDSNKELTQMEAHERANEITRLQKLKEKYHGTHRF